MKYFRKEKNKEILYIQNKDIKFIINYSYMPKYIQDIIPLDVLTLSSMDEYSKFTDQSIVKWFKDAFYILDSDEIDSMSISEIDDKIMSNTKKVNDLLDRWKKIPKKKRKENNELYNLSTLINYQTKSLKEELDKRKRTNMLKY
jgi:hypothetical protein